MPVSLFPSPSKRGDGAPGGARELARLPWAGLAIGPPARRVSGTQFKRGVGVPWRAGPRARRALRLPALQRDAIVGHRASLRHPTPLKTTPSMSEAARMISANFRPGISFAIREEIQRRQRLAAGIRGAFRLPKSRRSFCASSSSAVIAGLDPAIQLFAKRMDARVKPGHDELVRWSVNEKPC